MNGMMTTDDQTDERLKMVEGIAQKLWWGWIPRTSQRRWHIPFEQKHQPMTPEEREWFLEH